MNMTGGGGGLVAAAPGTTIDVQLLPAFQSLHEQLASTRHINGTNLGDRDDR